MTHTLTDSHIHLFENGFIGPEGRSPAGLSEVTTYERYRERYNVEAALVVGYEGEASYRGNNSYILDLANELPWVKPLVYVDHDATEEEISGWLERGAYGLSVYATEGSAGGPLPDLLARAAPILRERSALISINVAPVVYDDLCAGLRAHPDLRVLISHLGLPAKGADSPDKVKSALRELSRFKDFRHVYVKASGFYALGKQVNWFEVLSQLVDDFGASRLLWGSDYPVVLSAEPFDKTIEYLSFLPEVERQAVMYGNLQGLLGGIVVG